MNKNKIVILTEYITMLFQQYIEIKKSTQNIATYRLIDNIQKTDGTFQLVIQVIGTSTIFYSTPEKILSDDDLIERFSQKDIRTITYFGCQQIGNPKTSIVMKKFSEDLNQIIFGLKQVGSDEIIDKTAYEIFFDKKLLNSLSQEDSNTIAYIVANERCLSDVADMRKYKQQETTRENPC